MSSEKKQIEIMMDKCHHFYETECKIHDIHPYPCICITRPKYCLHCGVCWNAGCQKYIHDCECSWDKMPLDTGA